MANPQIEGNKAIFLWKGIQAPSLIGDFNAWDLETAYQLEPASAGMWQKGLQFPDDAYIEYTFVVDGKRVPDPSNPYSISDWVGHRNNYFSMPGMKPDPLTQTHRHPRAGFVTHHIVEDDYRLARPRRTVRLYHPADAGPHPLLVVFDGQDYYRRGRLVSIVDNLIAAGRIRPLALALIDHAGRRRIVEYACNDSTISFIQDRVLSLASQEIDLLDPKQNPGCHAVLGASMGGLMSLYTALRAPEIFGKTFSQAGAFSVWDETYSVYDLAEYGPQRPVRVWLDVGTFDFLLGTSQRMHSLLVKKGYQVTYREFNGGHNFTSWRNAIGVELVEGFGK